MIATSWVRSLLLAVTSFTPSHVIAIVLKADTADDVNLSLISWEHDSSGSSSHCIPAKIGCIVGSNVKKLVGFSIAAMSSGSGSRFGLWSQWGDVRQHQVPCNTHWGCVPFGICIAESSPLGCGSCHWRSPRGTGH